MIAVHGTLEAYESKTFISGELAVYVESTLSLLLNHGHSIPLPVNPSERLKSGV
jgi:hypothetical protein